MARTREHPPELARLDRFHHPDLGDPRPGVSIGLGEEEGRHLSIVLRHRRGDRVEVFDSLGRVVIARVESLGSKRESTVLVVEQVGGILDRTPRRRVRLAVAPPKGERLEWLIEKSAELGVEHVTLIHCRRGVASLEGGSPKLDKLRRKVIEVAKQCRRNRLMTIDALDFRTYLAQETAAWRWLCHPDDAQPPEPEALSDPQPLAALIGPEGGFESDELAEARAWGWRPTRLGSPILRVETAALVAAALALAASPPGEHVPSTANPDQQGD